MIGRGSRALLSKIVDILHILLVLEEGRVVNLADIAEIVAKGEERQCRPRPQVSVVHGSTARVG